MKMKHKNPKTFEIPDNPDFCPVMTYKEFQNRRPPQLSKMTPLFYMKINHNKKKDSEYWLKDQPLSEHKLFKIMKNMAETADFPGKKTNMSARKATCTRFLHALVTPITIMQLSDHKNIHSVNNYAVASHEMQNKV
ncbi:hypothetical protein KUTeg_012703 [Tegillarca granosa]|uniref:ZMYM2-like/QRICH1 C-terminal domain-containing protein n=1 Tax=Tegillarca granosa TaxID=220873 RepID=A0ABQ9F445_TEGGR|nr:hypothetical protein KUTeg_012228 [Tegillarca granosa]KAJ8310838.1 hypothetical protein KUTeg_012703 [Tegillarca granosa]